MRDNKSALYIAGAIVLAFGLYAILPNRSTSTSTNNTQVSAQATEVSYAGIDGQNALDLLKASHKVETTKYDFGEMVTSIDGVKADDKHFWGFNVNGAPATVGASAYQTKSTETISWRLTSL